MTIFPRVDDRRVTIILRRALLVELFALLVVCYAGVATLDPHRTVSPRIVDCGFVIGVAGLAYGLLGDWLRNRAASGEGE